jgi:hypothetical protein
MKEAVDGVLKEATLQSLLEKNSLNKNLSNYSI